MQEHVHFFVLCDIEISKKELVNQSEKIGVRAWLGHMSVHSLVTHIAK